MPTSTDSRIGTRKRPVGVSSRSVVTSSRVMPAASDPRVQLRAAVVSGLQERRRRRRAYVPPMYTQAVVRVLSQRGMPLEGHVLDLSETGLAVQVDEKIPVGQAVTVEFRVAGLGRVVADQWSEFAAAAIVVRQDDLEDFPDGPYKLALRFVRINTMAQAQIARFVATHPD